MHPSPATGQEWPAPTTSRPNPWLVHLSRGAWLRGHISLFAFGSVVLLTANLLRGSGGIWADTAISAWAVMILSHGILMIIARLLQELLAEEEDSDIRPAAEMHWNAPSTWTLPPRPRERKPAPPAPSPTPPTLDPEASAAAAAARDRRPRPTAQEPNAPPRPAQEPTAPTPASEEPADSERVSWQAATDAAWLAPRETAPKDGSTKDKPDDEDDFTPLRFD